MHRECLSIEGVLLNGLSQLLRQPLIELPLIEYGYYFIVALLEPLLQDGYLPLLTHQPLVHSLEGTL